jgi:hypothetical protein
MLCHKDHPLATLGTISWPESSIARPIMSQVGSECIPIDTIIWPKLRVRHHPVATTANRRFRSSNKSVELCFIP